MSHSLHGGVQHGHGDGDDAKEGLNVQKCHKVKQAYIFKTRTSVAPSATLF